MATKFSQFVAGGAIMPGDVIVGLRGGLNTQFEAAALPANAWFTLVVGQPLVANTNYFINTPGPATFTLPLVAPVGSTITIMNVCGQVITIAQNAFQGINIGTDDSTTGVTGSMTSNFIGDSITLVCQVANETFWSLNGPQGIWILA